MITGPFLADDIESFLKMAAAENWLAEAWEFSFLLAQFPEGCFCKRDGDGNAIAFVTSLRHERSGWVGNLIVSESFRGQGIGEELFRKAQESLHGAGVETFWLTASAMGRSLYEKHGFRSIDSIARWVGSGQQRRHPCGQESEAAAINPSVACIDSHSWGDRREPLLAATIEHGRVVCGKSGFIVVQSCGEALQLGPFSARDSVTAEDLFEQVQGSTPPGTRVFLDAPVSNRAALRLYNRNGMGIAGRNELMYAGVKPDYRPDSLYGLATMGSCG